MVTLTCLPKTNRQRHPEQAARVLQPVLQRLLYELHSTCLMPDREFQAHHAPDDPLLLLLCQ